MAKPTPWRAARSSTNASVAKSRQQAEEPGRFAEQQGRGKWAIRKALVYWLGGQVSVEFGPDAGNFTTAVRRGPVIDLYNIS